MKKEIASALILVVVWIAAIYAWDALRARVFPRLPPLGDIG